MDHRTDQHLNELFARAEQEQRFLVTHDATLQKELRRRVARGTVAMPRSQTYARPAYLEQLTPLERDQHAVRTEAALHPTWLFTHESAALMQGLFVSADLRETLHVASQYQRLSRGVQHHRGRYPHAQLSGGVRTTPLLQTMFDCLRTTDFEHGLPIADSALARLGITRDHAAELICAAWQGYHHLKRALATLAHADPKSPDGIASRVRALVIEQGFADPTLEVEVLDADHPDTALCADMFWMLADGTTVAALIVAPPDAAASERDTTRPYATTARPGRAIVRAERIVRIRTDKISRSGYVRHVLEHARVPHAARA